MLPALVFISAVGNGRFLCFDSEAIGAIVAHDKAFCEASGGSQCLSLYTSTRNTSTHLTRAMIKNACDSTGCYVGAVSVSSKDCRNEVLTTSNNPSSDMIRFASLSDSQFPLESDLNYGEVDVGAELKCILSSDVQANVLLQRDPSGLPMWVVAAGLPIVYFDSEELPALLFVPSSSNKETLKYGRITEGLTGIRAIPSGSGAIEFSSSSMSSPNAYVLPGHADNSVKGIQFFENAAVQGYSSINTTSNTYLSKCTHLFGLTISKFAISPGVNSQERPKLFGTQNFFNLTCSAAHPCQDVSVFIKQCTSCDPLTHEEASACTPYSDTICAALPTILPAGNPTNAPSLSSTRSTLTTVLIIILCVAGVIAIGFVIFKHVRKTRRPPPLKSSGGTTTRMYM